MYLLLCFGTLSEQLPSKRQCSPVKERTFGRHVSSTNYSSRPLTQVKTPWLRSATPRTGTFRTCPKSIHAWKFLPSLNPFHCHLITCLTGPSTFCQVLHHPKVYSFSPPVGCGPHTVSYWSRVFSSWTRRTRHSGLA